MAVIPVGTWLERCFPPDPHLGRRVTVDFPSPFWEHNHRRPCHASGSPLHRLDLPACGAPCCSTNDKRGLMGHARWAMSGNVLRGEPRSTLRGWASGWGCLGLRPHQDVRG